MTDKVYKRTDASRSIHHQDEFLASKVPGWPNVPTFFDDDRDMLVRPSTRRGEDTVYAGSFALYADREDDLIAFLRACKAGKRRITLIGAEEDFAWHPQRSISIAVNVWKQARKTGSAMRGAQMSAKAKKDKTAERFALIADRWPLSSKEHPAKALLKEAGIRSINTVNNLHRKVDRNGRLVTKTREEFQAEYQAKLKRIERNAKR